LCAQRRQIFGDSLTSDQVTPHHEDSLSQSQQLDRKVRDVRLLYDQQSTGSKHAPQLLQALLLIRQMMVGVYGDHALDGVRREWKLFCQADHRQQARLQSSLREHLGGHIGDDNSIHIPHQALGKAPGPPANIEQQSITGQFCMPGELISLRRGDQAVVKGGKKTEMI
jgi:hypothetical protein